MKNHVKIFMHGKGGFPDVTVFLLRNGRVMGQYKTVFPEDGVWKHTSEGRGGYDENGII